MRRLQPRRLVFLALATVLATPPALAQADARISGVVRDARGTALEAARITVTNTETRVTRITTTSIDGAYGISGLTEGAYTIAVSLVGFRPVSRELRVTGDATADFTLEAVPLQPVTVTATLREQQLGDVPFSVAAPTASVLRQRGADELEDIALNVAGFSVQNLGPGQSQVAVRGVSSGQISRDQPGVKEQVGAYLDDSPISLSLFTPDLDLFDVARVEVLRGPQGTLFGAGSLSGTVRYITSQPELGLRSMFGEVGGNWVDGGSGGVVAKAGTNVPLGDRAAARVVVYHNRIGGFMDAVNPDFSVDKNINGGTKTGARAALRFLPTERLSITPRVVVQSVRMQGFNRIDVFNILANPYTTSRPPVTLGQRELFLAVDEPYHDDLVLGDLRLQYDFAGAILTSITSYTYRDVGVRRDGGALYASIVGGSIGLPEPIYTLNNPFDDSTTSRVFTQELRLAGETGRTRWLVGAFYSGNHRDYGQSVRVPGFEAVTGMPTRGLRARKDEIFFSDLAYDLSQAAVFGEATFAVGDRLDLTAGLRYYDFNEDRDQVFDGALANPQNGVAVISVPGSTDANGFAPRFIASFRPNESLTLNAQASKGFRLGGINDPINETACTPEDRATFRGRNAWRDESAWNYEIGAKSQTWDDRLSLNLAAFYMDIRDLQVTVTAGSCTSRLIYNVPKATSFGTELELVAAPSERFDVSLSATLTQSELRSTLISVDSTGAESVVSGVREGNRLPSVPRIQGAASASWRWPVRVGMDGFLTATYQYVGTRYTQADDLADGFGTLDMTQFEAEGGQTIGGPLSQSTFTFDPKLPAYDLINVRAGIMRPSWEIALFVNNLADERAFLSLDRERGARARVGYLTNQPRTVGLTMAFSY
jgi:iron complex outermembrane receptor protein